MSKITTYFTYPCYSIVLNVMWVVAVGECRGIYGTHDDAKRAIGSVPIPLVKEFDDREEALLFLGAFTACDEIVYTDGACSGNGKDGARAGVGVFWGLDDPRNVSRPVHGSHTNNVAELEAIGAALDSIGHRDRVVIVSDSQYSISCLTTWRDGFIRRGWKTSKGIDVKNRELIEEILEKLKARPHVSLVHVRGHVGHLGNHHADTLAVSAVESKRK